MTYFLKGKPEAGPTSTPTFVVDPKESTGRGRPKSVTTGLNDDAPVVTSCSIISSSTAADAVNAKAANAAKANETERAKAGDSSEYDLLPGRRNFNFHFICRYDGRRRRGCE